MGNTMARDQSKNRRWSKHGDSYMMSVRIKEPLLTDFREFCESVGMNPCDVMRTALRVYMDSKVRRVMRRRITRYEDEIKRI